MTKSLIDYTEESYEDSPKAWTHQAFKQYFVDTYHKVHHVGGAVPWTMKEQSLLKTLRREYNADSLANMMLWWHMNTQVTTSSRFGSFYTNRVHIYLQMKKATNDYKWD